MQPSLIVLIAALIPLVFWIVIALFRWLWNITMPQVFGLKTITFWQAFRLLFLAGMLFNGGGAASISGRQSVRQAEQVNAADSR